MDYKEKYIRQAIEIAEQARKHGNHPFGALLVIDGLGELTAENTVNSDRNPLSHAETNLVQIGIRRLTQEQLGKSTLYTSCEPCAMCAGAIYWAGIRKVVYGISSEELAKLTGGEMNISCREIYARTRDGVEVEGPILIDEARKAHEGYWKTDKA